MPDDLIPQSDERFGDFLNNLSAKLAGKYKAAFNLPAAQLTALDTDAETWEYWLGCETATRFADDQATAGRNTLRDGPAASLPVSPLQPAVLPAPPATLAMPGIEKRLRDLVQFLKKHPAYTEAIGADLGIIAPRNPAAHDTPLAPAVRALSGFGLEVKTRMYGHDAQEIFAQRAGDEAPVRVDKFTAGTAHFTLAPRAVGPSSEEVTISARYLDHDQPVGDGLLSPAVTVSTRRR